MKPELEHSSHVAACTATAGRLVPGEAQPELDHLLAEGAWLCAGRSGRQSQGCRTIASHLRGADFGGAGLGIAVVDTVEEEVAPEDSGQQAGLAARGGALQGGKREERHQMLSAAPCAALPCQPMLKQVWPAGMCAGPATDLRNQQLALVVGGRR